MAELLEKAFAEAAKLPEDQQESFAQWMLEVLEDETRWDNAFAQSLDQLETLGKKALAEYHAGQTEILDPDNLG
jgi:hypothetical protein